MNYFIYLIFGRNKEVHVAEWAYSVLSCKAQAGSWAREGLKILVYTDEKFPLPDVLTGMHISYICWEPSCVSDWIKQAHGHSLVLKARVMQDFFDRYDGCGILVDTDTFFIKDPGPLFARVREGSFLLHVREYSIAWKPEVHAFLSKKSFNRTDGRTITMGGEFHMWNSGVVGIPPPGAQRLMAEIITLIEQIAAEDTWPAEERKFIEQTAYSYYFQQFPDRLLATDEYVFHYWFFKHARFLLAYCFRYFHGLDRYKFRELLGQLHYDPAHLERINLHVLPGAIMKLIAEYLPVEDYFFECLPAGSLVGNLLRSSVLKG